MSQLTPRKKRTTISLTGWLFADLMLGLWALFMVIIPVSKPAPPPTLTPTSMVTLTATSSITQKPTRITTPSLTIIPTVTPTVFSVDQIGLSKAQCYNLELQDTYTGDGSEQKAILGQLQNMLPNDRSIHAGLVLIWGHGADIYEGRQIAKRVGAVLDQYFNGSFGSGTEKKSMGFDHGNYKHVQIEVYFFTTSQWKSGYEVRCEFID